MNCQRLRGTVGSEGPCGPLWNVGGHNGNLEVLCGSGWHCGKLECTVRGWVVFIGEIFSHFRGQHCYQDKKEEEISLTGDYRQ